MKNCCAIVPISAEWGNPELLLKPIGGSCALARTINSLKDCGAPLSITITTDSAPIYKYVESYFPDINLVHRSEKEYVNAIAEALNHIHCKESDVIIAEATHPFRPSSLFTQLIKNKRSRADLEAIICVRPLGHRLWGCVEGQSLSPLEPFANSSNQPTQLFEEFYGLGSIVDSELVFNGHLRGNHVGFEVINNFWSAIDINTEESLKAAEVFAKAFTH